MSIRITGVESAVARVGKYANTDAMARSAAAGCEVVRHKLRSDFLAGQSVNIVTSRLIGSWNIWQYESPVPGANLYTDVFYARFLEYGTQRIRPRRFLKEATAAARPGIKPAVLEAWRSAIASS